MDVCIVKRWRRHFCQKAVWSQRSGDHEDYEQNKQNVDQRSYINVRGRYGTFDFAHLHSSTLTLEICRVRHLVSEKVPGKNYFTSFRPSITTRATVAMISRSFE